MKTPFFACLLLLLFCVLSPAQAAFGKHSQPVVGTPTANGILESTRNTTLTGTRLLMPKMSLRKGLQLWKQIRKFRTPANNITQAEAAVLCLTLGALGIHRFKMGYKNEGAAQLTLLLIGLFALMLNAITIIGPMSIFPGAYGVALLFFAILGLWVLIDFFMIITGKLKPRNGSFETSKRLSEE